MSSSSTVIDLNMDLSNVTRDITKICDAADDLKKTIKNVSAVISKEFLSMKNILKGIHSEIEAVASSLKH